MSAPTEPDLRAKELARLTSTLSRKTFNRRRFVGGGLAGAAAMGLSGRAAGQNPVPRRGERVDEALFLADHATQGFNLTTYWEIQQKGYDAWLEEQLDWESIDDSEVDQILDLFPTLKMTGQQLWDGYPDPSTPIWELRFANLIRSLYSRRQLYERMVEFWTDHFNIYHFKFGPDLLKTVDERVVMRKHALGKFPDMLKASTRSGAMLWYLDNTSNFAGNPNENYAREVFELHTLGVNGGFTETDVKEFARCLTGWNINYPDSGKYGTWRFYYTLHDQGVKQVLGTTIPSFGGKQDTLTVLDIISNHPSTAEFVSRKMVSWLLVNDPPQSIVDDVTAVYLSTGGDIKEMVRTIFSGKSVRQAMISRNPKLRRPYHFLISMFRASYPDITDLIPPLIGLQIMGHMPYTWVTPDGPSDVPEFWGSGLHPRWWLASLLFEGGFPGVHISAGTLLGLVGNLPQPELAQKINLALAGGRMPDHEVAAVQDVIDSHPVQNFKVLREAFALAASSPSFQSY